MTDTELLDFLEALHSDNEYASDCVLRMSTTGRGYRLHPAKESGHGTVRAAIEAFAAGERQ